MKVFDAVIINNDQHDNVKGIYYQDGHCIYIDNPDHFCVSVFRKILRGKTHIKNIEFISKGEAISLHSGAMKVLEIVPQERISIKK